MQINLQSWKTQPLIAGQRGHLFPWVPVFLSMGIGLYFALRFEPNIAHYGLLVLVTVGLFFTASTIRENLAPFLLAIALVFSGVLLAGVRSHAVSEPVLTFRYYGPIQGRVIKIDRSASEATRLTLDRVILDNLSPERTPSKVRVSLHGDQGFIALDLGLTVILSGHLSPPSGAVEPGGFNFRKMAWFQGLGAVGYTRSPVLALTAARHGKAGLLINRFRRKISTAVQAAIPGEEGTFAAAILTGDRSDMSRATLQNLRNSNLAHLLAISGLHMGMLTGFVFAAVRIIFAFFPSVSMRVPVKKVAALVALTFGAGYLAMSGGNVATIRAFIMVSVMLSAILLNRRALTLRAVAIAAIIILVLQPESLTGPGFQMSFAATAALVAVFGAMRDFPSLPIPKFLRGALAVVLSSFIAGLATAPIAAVHFNQIAQYGLIANVITVPLMGVLVMPAAVVAVLLVPFGLQGLALEVMRWGIWWILEVAERVSHLEGALRLVVTPDPIVLPLLALGGVILIIWRGYGRLLGVPLLIGGFAIWSQTTRPDILISDTGTLVGVMTPQGRALSKAKGAGFVADSWLENDGDGSAQLVASERGKFERAKGKVSTEFNGYSILQLSGKKANELLEAGCRTHDLVVTNVKSEPLEGCMLIDPITLRKTGSIAVYQTPSGLKMITAHQLEGQRLWSPVEKKKRRSFRKSDANNSSKITQKTQ
ncbi:MULTISPECIES: ComEC/Rec2 family competence protein [Falsihalocynthiibacter]|uniref:ComEC/Rec2 family competence protein n=1 Tax=Falsihalocynthiibacter TaxID=2854182 RepID=UPI003002E0E0